MTTQEVGDRARRPSGGRRPRHGSPTIRQVAAAAGVSRATASRVINGGALVSDQSRAAVEAAIAQLGFRPNPMARGLARGRTGSVALVVPEPNTRVLSDPFFAETIVGLSTSLEEHELQMVLLLARAGGRTERIVQFLAGGHVDGVVIASHHRDQALDEAVQQLELPCVFIGRPLGVVRAAYVDMDNVLGARMAAEHLVASGRRRLGTVAGPGDMSAGIDRLRGWQEALTEAGLPTDAVEAGDFTTEGGGAAARRLLAAHPDIDGLFVASDPMAAGALGVLAEHGRRVPQDVAVVGFDDLGYAETTDPPLTTVAQPVARIAERAGEMLQGILSGLRPEPTPELFPPRLVRRASA